MNHKYLFFSLLLLAAVLPQAANAQAKRLFHDVDYGVEISATASTGDNAPLWLSANRYGLSSAEASSGYLRAHIGRSTQADSARRWRIGYGLNIAAAVNNTSTFIVHQAFADFDWRALRLSVGAKERGEALKNAALSSGGLTLSDNARPVPQVRIELPEFWSIPGTRGWLAIKGHIAYGVYTDNAFQRDVHPEGGIYSQNSLFHSKAGFLRIGNTEKFPLTFTGGLEMAAQFGGEAWNVGKRDDDPNFDNSHVKAGHGFSSFWHAFIPGGSDAFDGDYKNNEGNQLGSWHLQLAWNAKSWGLKVYAEHFFEDHSQMFLQYGWKDMLWGIEATLPKNPVVSTVLYEHIRTTDQTGGLYHDATDALPVQTSGVDNYYNHSFYGAWQHWGQALGNPLLISPIYNADGSLTFRDNRVTAHHIGLSGQPLPTLSYRLLFSHIRSLGTYANPAETPRHGSHFLVEAAYTPQRLKQLSVKAAFATSAGQLPGTSVGGMITLAWNGVIK